MDMLYACTVTHELISYYVTLGHSSVACGDEAPGVKQRDDDGTFMISRLRPRRFRSEHVRHVSGVHVVPETHPAGELHVQNVDGLAPQRQIVPVAENTRHVRASAGFRFIVR